jgi:hypothetical protein
MGFRLGSHTRPPKRRSNRFKTFGASFSIFDFNDRLARRGRNMGKVATRLRSVTYTLSPMRTGVMHGLFKDWAAGMAKRVKENVVDAGLFCAVPLFGTMAYVTRRATRFDDDDGDDAWFVCL